MYVVIIAQPAVCKYRDSCVTFVVISILTVLMLAGVIVAKALNL